MKRFFAIIVLGCLGATASAQNFNAEMMSTTMAASAVKIPDVIINPNPVVQGKTFSLELQNLEKGKYSVYLFDNTGKKYLIRILDVEAGNDTQQFDLPKNTGSGTYILQVVSKTARFSKKMIVE